MKSISYRIEGLEKKHGNIPLAIAEYANGEKIKYTGAPPIEHFNRSENPLVRTYGSEFADMINVLLHPLPNRNIEDFE